MQDIPNDILNKVKAIEGCDGILYTGSRQQGSATTTSDWDFYVLLSNESKSFRRTWIHGNTHIETFCNTLASINENELVTSKISNPALNMLATGTIVFDSHGRLADVQSKAQQIYTAGPPKLDDEALAILGYVIRTLIDDLESLGELSVPGYYLQNGALVTAIESFYKLKQRWMAKPRQVEANLQTIDNHWANLYIEANEAVGTQKTAAIIKLLKALINKHNVVATGEVYQLRK